jgi:hypothetical protein
MSFVQPLLLWGLPLAALPIIIHLIHLHRRRTVQWAAMMFLLAAQKMNKGFSRIRRWLILAFRVASIAALIFVIGRPLAGGWLGLTGGVPDTVLILLDRSASMEQQNPLTGVSKRLTGLRKLADAMQETYAGHSHLILIDSATMKPQPLEKASALLDHPQCAATETAADITGLLQGALDYISTNHTGRTDVWLLSDARESDWQPSSGRWEALRGAFRNLQGLRFHVLNYPQSAPENLSITVENVTRRETPEKAELLMDIHLMRHEPNAVPVEVPLRFVINGASSTAKVTLKDNELSLQGYALAIDRSLKRGWGRVELPADAQLSDNAFHFVFDELPALKSVIVSDDPAQADPMKAALNAAADPMRHYVSTVLSVARAAEIPWDDTALIVWHAPIPKEDDLVAKQLANHVAQGRSLIFLPVANPSDDSFAGLHWGAAKQGKSGKPEHIEWWRNDSGLLANTRNGAALPLADVEVMQHWDIVGEGVPLARLDSHDTLLVRSAETQGGGVWFLGTTPGPGVSSLAQDGVALYVMLQRALSDGARTLGKAQQRVAAHDALGDDQALSKWHRATEAKAEPIASFDLPLRAGVVESGEKLVALNRPATEDNTAVLGNTTLDELFAGLDYRRIEDTIENTKGLTSEVWRTFLILMCIFLVGEAILSMPQKRELPAEAPKVHMPEKERELEVAA